MASRRMFYVLFLLLSLWALPALSAAQSTSPRLRVQAFSYLPLFYGNDAGEFRGLMVDYWKMVGEKAGFQVRFRMGPWVEAIPAITDGKADVIAGLFYSPERDRQLDFTRPYFTAQSCLYRRIRGTPNLSEVHGLEDLTSYTIGGIREDYNTLYVKEHFPEIALREYAQYEELIQGALRGEVDAFVMEQPGADTYLAKFNGLDDFAPSPSPLFQQHIYAAVKQGKGELLQRLNRAMEAITDEERRALFRAWRSRPVASPPDQLRVALPEKSPPWSYQSETGPAGALVEYWQAWSEYMQIPVEIHVLPWSQCGWQVAGGALDVYGGCFRENPFSDQLICGTPLFQSRFTYFFHESIFGLKEVEDLAGFRIGVLHGDAGVPFLREALPIQSLALFASREELAQALKAGRIRVFLSTESQGKALLQEYGLAADFHFPQGKPLFERFVCPATAPEKENWLSWINEGFNQADPWKFLEIQRRYGLIRRPQPQEKSLLRVAFSPSFFPFTLRSPEGKPAGMFIDIWRLWSQKTGIPVQFQPYDFQEAEQALLEGQADVLCAVSRNLDQQKPLHFLTPLYQIGVHVFYPDFGPGYESLKDLDWKRVGVVKRSAADHYIKKHHPLWERVPYSTVQDLVQASLLGEIDAFVGEGPPVRSILAQKGRASAFRYLRNPLFIESVSPAIHADEEKLVEDVARGISAIRQEELMEIEERWSPDFSSHQYYQHVYALNLTASEKSHLQRGRPFSVAIHPDWAPLSFRDGEGRYQGLLADYVALIRERLEMEMPWHNGQDWQENMDAFQSGEVKILAGVHPTENLGTVADFTIPCLELPLVLIARSDAGEVRGLADLDGARLATPETSPLMAWLNRDYPDVQCLVLPSARKALEMVSEGKAEAALATVGVAMYHIHRQGFSNLRIAAATPYKYSLALAVPRGEELLVGILNKTLRSISPVERDSLYEKWMAPPSPEARPDLTRIWRFVFQGGAVLLMALVLILIWNWRLNQEVRHRRRAEAALAEKAQELENSNRELQQFAYVTSHDLQEPLRSIAGYIQLLRKRYSPHLDEKARHYVDRSVAATKRLQQRIESILELSRLTTEEGQREEVDLQKLLENVLDDLSRKIEEEGAQVEIAETLPLIEGDPVQLSRLFENLISNALKFRTAEPPCLTIRAVPTIIADHHQRRWRFEVEDNGIGIEPEQREKVFQVFKRLNPGEDYPGVGMGLSLCRKIVENHNGHIWAESTLKGRGARICFVLPEKAAHG